MTASIVLRGAAAEACIARFSGRALDWGKVDCAKIAGHNLRQLGIGTPLLKGARYGSELGAAKALRELGFKGLGPAMDAMGLPRIPPAMATIGDVVGMACDGELWDLALAVSVGNGRIFGIMEGIAMTMQPDLSKAVAAWRCDPCRR